MSRLRAAKEDHTGVQAMKDNMLRIYNELMKKNAQAQNPDQMHDILNNVDAPTTETQLSGQRTVNKSGFGKEMLNSSPKENNRNPNGEVGQQGDEGIQRNKAGEVGQLGPPEQAQPYAGEAVRSQFEEVGGATNDPGMIGDQVADPSANINHQKDSLGHDSASTLEKQLNGDKPMGVPPRITNNKSWQPEKVVGPPVSRRKRTKRGR